MILEQIEAEIVQHEMRFGRTPTHVSIGPQPFLALMKENRYAISFNAILGLKIIYSADNEIRVGRF